MKILKLHHPTGHPYWQKNKFKVELPDRTFSDIFKFSKYNGENGEEVEVYSLEAGIFVKYFMCSSGSGKCAYGIYHLLVDRNEYDKVEYAGEPLTISQNLINEIAENDKFNSQFL